jgi:Abortive infection alpha
MPGAAPLLGDLNLESLSELGASVILIRNLATELVDAVEHLRSAGTGVWNALNLLRYPDDSSDARAESASPSGSVGGLLSGNAAGCGSVADLLNPLGVVGRAAGASDIQRLLNFPTGATSPPRTQQATEPSGSAAESASEPGSWNPFTAVTDAVNEVLGGARRQENQQSASEQSSSQPNSGTATANGDPSSDAGAASDTRASSATATPPAPQANKSASTVRPPDNLLSALLGSNPATDVLGRAIGSATQPVQPVIEQVGEGLRQVATAPWTGVRDVVDKVVTGGRDETDSLRKRGNKLIRISYKPELQRRDVHPSFSHILDELLPDEARIVRFLGVAGTQPMIDVRTKTLFQIGSVLLVGGVSMVASMAGCHWPDRDQHYFANLNRLGLIDLSPEPVDDYRRYALLEVQPVALHAIENASKAITIYRSIRLTAFGRQFIEVCINTEGYNAGGWDTDGRQDKIRGKRLPDHVQETG